MAREKAAVRRRIGRVSLYLHRRLWYGYFRRDGLAVRQPLGWSEPEAEIKASLLNAQLVAGAAGLPIAEFAKDLVPSGLSGDGSTVPGAVPSISIAELRRRFLHHHEEILRSAPGTVARYATATRHLEDFCAKEGTVDAMAVSALGFTQCLRTIEVSPNGHAHAARRRLRDKGVIYILATCRSMFHFGQRHGHLPRHVPNPFSEIGVGKLRVRDAKAIFVFGPQQELDFLNAAEPWDFAIHFTLAKTGLRSGELVRLLIEDLDLAQGWLHVRSKAELGWLIKTNRERRVPLVAELADVLKTVVGNRPAGPVFRRPRFVGGPFEACSRAQLAKEAQTRWVKAQQRKGQSLTRKEQAAIHLAIWHDAGAIDTDDVRNSFIRIATKAGLAATCPKSWRHTFATLMQEANVDLLVRQETMGHRPSAMDSSALGMTGVYTHTTPQFQRQEIERALQLREPSLQLACAFANNHNNRALGAH